jgi:hypothetical protein
MHPPLDDRLPHSVPPAGVAGKVSPTIWCSPDASRIGAGLPREAPQRRPADLGDAQDRPFRDRRTRRRRGVAADLPGVHQPPGWIVLRTRSDTPRHRDPGPAPLTRRTPTTHAAPADRLDRALIAATSRPSPAPSLRGRSSESRASGTTDGACTNSIATLPPTSSRSPRRFPDDVAGIGAQRHPHRVLLWLAQTQAPDAGGWNVTTSIAAAAAVISLATLVVTTVPTGRREDRKWGSRRSVTSVLRLRRRRLQGSR